MIATHQRHPSYSIDMELLCLLPVAPAAAVMKDIADDLGCDTVSELHPMMARLNRRGFKLTTFNDGGARCLAISNDCWTKAKRVASDYLRTVSFDRREPGESCERSEL